jgi:enamine deaminase RidA (YjgF/YER057c/UK114 family)
MPDGTFSRSSFSISAGVTMQSSKKTITFSNPHPVLGNTGVFEAFNYAPAVAAGGLLFVAGQIGLRADGAVPESVEEQIDLAFQRLGAILQEAGLGFEDLVELVSYHVKVGQQLAIFRKIKDRYIKVNAPTWTILGVEALARPTLLIEIKAVAALRNV